MLTVQNEDLISLIEELSEDRCVQIIYAYLKSRERNREANKRRRVLNAQLKSEVLELRKQLRISTIEDDDEQLVQRAHFTPSYEVDRREDKSR